jgi:flagellar biosynthesis chaperone FliJ
MENVNIGELSGEIGKLELLIQCHRQLKDWEEANKLSQLLEPLQEKYDAILRRLQHERDMKEMDDWYDDEKNRDAYTSRIVEEQFSDMFV